MADYSAQILSTISLVPMVVGIVRYRQIDAKFRPFVWYLVLGAVTELLSAIVIYSGHSNALITNIYIVLGYCLLLYIGWIWSERKARRFFWVLAFFFLFCWAADALLISSIWQTLVVFRIACSFILVLVFVNVVNVILAEQTSFRSRRGHFLLVMCLILLMTVKVLVEIFFLYGSNRSLNFLILIFRIYIYVNVAVHLGNTFALLWIPRKRESLLLLR